MPKNAEESSASTQDVRRWAAALYTQCATATRTLTGALSTKPTEASPASPNRRDLKCTCAPSKSVAGSVGGIEARMCSMSTGVDTTTLTDDTMRSAKHGRPSSRRRFTRATASVGLKSMESLLVAKQMRPAEFSPTAKPASERHAPWPTRASAKPLAALSLVARATWSLRSSATEIPSCVASSAMASLSTLSLSKSRKMDFCSGTMLSKMMARGLRPEA